MLAENDLRRLFHKLMRQFSAKVHFAGLDITINFYDHASKVQLSTPVYLGGSYIPKSVRESIRERAPFDTNSLRTHFTIDEDTYRIILNYNGALNRNEDYLFQNLIEDFGFLADEWRSLLDERDKNDLIYIHNR